ncbi:MAG: hypothetical protein ACQEQU_04320 [Spirochaetota bacterium]
MNRTAKTLLLIVQILLFILITAAAVYELFETGRFSIAEVFERLLTYEEPEIESAFVHSLLLLGFSISFYVTFGRATSPEISYLMLAACVFMLMDLRVAMILVDSLTPSQSLIMKKGIYLLRLYGISLLFCSGLFHSGVAYQKQYLFMLISLCASVALVYLVPVNNLEPASFTSVISNSPLLVLARLIEVLAVINYIAAGLRSGNRTFYYIAFGMLLFIAGNETLMTASSSVFLILGAAAMVAGTAFMLRKFYLLHLWS